MSAYDNVGVMDLHWGQNLGQLVVAAVYFITAYVGPSYWSRPVPLSLPYPMTGCS